MKNNNLLIILLLLIIFSIGCKKNVISPIESECLYIERDTTGLKGIPPVKYYYNTEKKLKARLNWDASTPILDSIVYLTNGNTLTMSYYIANFKSKDEWPTRFTIYHKKIEYIHENNKIAKINYSYFHESRKVDIPTSSDSMVYEGDKLSKIYKTGRIQIPNSREIIGKQIYELAYTNNNVKSIISRIVDDTEGLIGGDTTQYHTFTNLKNPYKKLSYINDMFLISISENMPSSSSNSYYYKFQNGSFSFGSSNWSGILTDNGKGYPKEIGVYKCD